jgi:hypothetical protein
LCEEPLNVNNVDNYLIQGCFLVTLLFEEVDGRIVDVSNCISIGIEEVAKRRLNVEAFRIALVGS